MRTVHPRTSNFIGQQRRTQNRTPTPRHVLRPESGYLVCVLVMMLHERVRILIVLSAGAERYVLAARFAVAVKDTAERGVAHVDRELPDSARERERGEAVGHAPSRWVRVSVDGWVCGCRRGRQVPPWPCITRVSVESDSQEVRRHGDAPVQHKVPPIPGDVEEIEREGRQHEAPALKALEHVLVQLLDGWRVGM